MKAVIMVFFSYCFLWEVGAGCQSTMDPHEAHDKRIDHLQSRIRGKHRSGITFLGSSPELDAAFQEALRQVRQREIDKENQPSRPETHQATEDQEEA